MKTLPPEHIGSHYHPGKITDPLMGYKIYNARQGNTQMRINSFCRVIGIVDAIILSLARHEAAAGLLLDMPAWNAHTPSPVLQTLCQNRT
jgi:hypothetical protein